MTAAKRAMSILLSATMLMGNLVSPMTAFAGETGTEGNEAYEIPVGEAGAEQPVAEAPDYLVTIPYYEEAAFMVDENHVKKREDEKETVLAYKAGDDVKITVSQREGFELEEIRIFDDKKNEQGYTWEKEDTFVFLMPEKDLQVKASFRELPVEAETAATAAENNEAAEDIPAPVESTAPSEDPAMDDTSHSLSVSDIVVIHRDGEDKAYYVDRFGYTEVPEFLAPAQEAERSSKMQADRSDDLQENGSGSERQSPQETQQLPREAKQLPQPEEKLTFYVAECMEFPVMGEYHDGLSLIEALKLYQEMPDSQSGKGIGVTLRDGSEFSGDFALVAAGRVQEDVINGVEHYRLDPDIQAAIAEVKTYIPGSVPERGADDRTADVKPEKTPERAAEPSRKEERSGSKKEKSPKKESVWRN